MHWISVRFYEMGDISEVAKDFMVTRLIQNTHCRLALFYRYESVQRFWSLVKSIDQIFSRVNL